MSKIGVKGLISKSSIKRAAAAATPESAIQQAILDYLTLRRIPHTITEAKRSYNERGQIVRRVNPGWPDITACFAGFFVGIEVKRPVGGRLSYLQAVELEALYRSGALVVIARGLDDVIALLESKRTSQATKDEIAAALAKGTGKK